MKMSAKVIQQSIVASILGWGLFVCWVCLLHWYLFVLAFFFLHRIFLGGSMRMGVGVRGAVVQTQRLIWICYSQMEVISRHELNFKSSSLMTVLISLFF